MRKKNNVEGMPWANKLLLVLILVALVILRNERAPSEGGAGVVPSSLSSSSSSSSSPPSSRDPNKLDAGWGKAAERMYQKKVAEIRQASTKSINLAREGRITVTSVVNESYGNDFWKITDESRVYKADLFTLFRHYITPETIVIDIGTWLGSTLLFHGQTSKRSYGVEADPAAYAVVEENVRLNRDRDWGGNVHVEPVCVSTPRDAGSRPMYGTRIPGAATSGLRKKLFLYTTRWWRVQCYSLPTLLDHWGVDLSKQPVFVTMDVNTYECKLVPSLYEWFRDEPRLPTLHIRFSPNVKDCTKDEWEGILKVFQLYDKIHPQRLDRTWKFNEDTTVDDLEELMSQIRWKKRDSEFVLAGNRKADPPSQTTAIS